MPEHFNIAVAVGHVIPLESRPEVIGTLARIFAPFFDNFHEVCKNNYKDGTSQCEKWPAGEALLKAKIEGDELLFIYGEKSEPSSCVRSSLHVEERDSRMVFLISLPISPEADSLHLQQYVIETKKAIDHISDSFIVAAGWELECDAAENMENLLHSYVTHNSSCLWIAAPKRLIPHWPTTFVKVSESDQAILLKNYGKK